MTEELSQHENAEQFHAQESPSLDPNKPNHPRLKNFGIGLAIPPATLGASIVVELGANHIVDSAKVGHEPSHIIFEPGIHPLTAAESAPINRGIANRENVHLWNPEVAQRIREYQPGLIAIDSLYPIEPKYETSYKELVWLFLPDRVNNLTNNGRVFVIAGDSFVSRGLEGMSRAELLQVEIAVRLLQEGNRFSSNSDLLPI